MLRFLLFLSILVSNIFADTNITIDKKGIYDNFKIEYIKDDTSKLTIKDISKKKFIKVNNQNLDFFYGSNAKLRSIINESKK